MIFGKNKYSNTDFSATSLPKNRFKLFLDIYKNKTSLLLNIGLLLFIFSIPLILIEFIFNGLINNIVNLDLTDDLKYTEMVSTINTKNLILIIGFFILSIGISGISQIIRRLIFNSDILFWLDFKKGVKENFLTNFVIALIFGILNFIINYLFINNTAFNNSYKIALAIVIALIILITPICLVTSSQATIYNLKLIHKFKNAFIITFSAFFVLCPLGLVNIGVFLLPLINNVIVYFIIIFILPLFIAPMLLLINMIVIDIYLDKYINKESFNEIYRKGLYKNE